MGQSAEKRKAAAAATSSALPIRPTGKDAFCFACHSGHCSVKRSTIGVAVVDGQMALTRMPADAYSRAALFVSPMMAHLLAE